MEPHPTLEQVIQLLAASEQGAYFGEPVSQLEHALQTAHFARQAKANDALVTAALLHDIGHLCAPDQPQMEGMGAMDHDKLGGDYLRRAGFQERVCQLVAGHVEVKRYKAATQLDYLQELSEASLQTLMFQGGAMNEQEAESFRKSPLFQELLLLRACDEQAKVPGLQVEPLAYYRPYLIRCLTHAGL